MWSRVKMARMIKGFESRADRHADLGLVRPLHRLRWSLDHVHAPLACSSRLAGAARETTWLPASNQVPSLNSQAITSKPQLRALTLTGRPMHFRGPQRGRQPQRSLSEAGIPDLDALRG